MTNLDFDMPQNQASTIKVIGVGGGGSNAVNYMYVNGIRGVDFVVCNTDQQALDDSPVPNKIQLGVSVTKGLGAGADPLRGKIAAEENIEDVISVLENNTEMVFINAGMGGGTGTGAAPVIAKAAKDMNILTVAIVTIPFEFEGGLRKSQAKEGIEELKQYVDSLIVINNNKLREIYGKLGFKSGFAKADEILATASRGIAEVITQTGHLNIDLNDARTVLSNSGTAIMGTGTASGDDRAIKSVKGAIESPLLDNNHIRGAKKVLLLIVSGAEEVTFEEMGEISDFIQDQVTVEGGAPADIIMGVAEDEELGDAVNVTVVATGFHEGKDVNPLTGIPVVVKHDLDADLPAKEVLNKAISMPINKKLDEVIEVEVKHVLEDAITETELVCEEEIEQVLEPESTDKSVSEDLQQVSMTFEFEIEEPKIEEQIFPVDNGLVDLESTEDTVQEVEHTPLVTTEELNENEDKVVFELSEESSVEIEASANTMEPTLSPSTEGKIVHTLCLDEDEEIDSSVARVEEEESMLSFNVSSPSVEPTLRPDVKVEHEALPENEVEVIQEECIEEVKEIEQSMPSENTSSVTLSSHSDTAQEQIERAKKRKDRLQKFNYRLRNNGTIDKAESEPAYKRQGVQLTDKLHSTDEPLSRMSLSTNESGEVELKSRNSFLHDNVD